MTVQFTSRRTEEFNPRSWAGQAVIIDLLRRRASISVCARGWRTCRILFNSSAFQCISKRVNTTNPLLFIKHNWPWKARPNLFWFITTFLRRADYFLALSGLINILRRLFRFLDARWVPDIMLALYQQRKTTSKPNPPTAKDRNAAAMSRIN